MAVFAENEWRAAERLCLTADPRYDDHSGSGGQLSPRAHAVTELSEAWTLKGGVARGYRTPALAQLEDGIQGVSVHPYRLPHRSPRQDRTPGGGYRG